MTPKATLLVLATLALAGDAFAGTLTPDASPAPTMRTLHEVRPGKPITRTTSDEVVLSEPGHYYLAGHVTSAFTTIAAIRITSPGVVLDLNGFTVGQFGSPGLGTNGISIEGDGQSAVIRNGFLFQNPARGIWCSGDNSHAILENVSVIGSGGIGIECDRVTMRGGDVADNGSAGIFCVGRCSLDGVRIASNNGAGVFTGNRSVIRRTLLINNALNQAVVCPGGAPLGDRTLVVQSIASGSGGVPFNNCTGSESFIDP